MGEKHSEHRRGLVVISDDLLGGRKEQVCACVHAFFNSLT